MNQSPITPVSCVPRRAAGAWWRRRRCSRRSAGSRPTPTRYVWMYRTCVCVRHPDRLMERHTSKHSHPHNDCTRPCIIQSHRSIRRYIPTHPPTHPQFQNHTQVAEPAVSALTNLCADELPQVVDELLRRGIVDRLMEVRSIYICVCFGFESLYLYASSGWVHIYSTFVVCTQSLLSVSTDLPSCVPHPHTPNDPHTHIHINKHTHPNDPKTHPPTHHPHQHKTVTSEDCGFRDRALMLLANVSATARGARRMMQVC